MTEATSGWVSAPGIYSETTLWAVERPAKTKPERRALESMAGLFREDGLESDQEYLAEFTTEMTVSREMNECIS